jgi:hypothetical protein
MRKLLASAVSVLMVAGFVVASANAAPPSEGSVACNDGVVTWSPTTLWPPNHKMQTITISYTDADHDGDNTSVMIGAITDDQASADGSDELQGSGQPTDKQGLDWAGTGNHASSSDPDAATTTAEVRAERSGTDKTGRTYTIKVTCMDSGGMPPEMESQTVDVTVTVPHDQGNH